MRLPSLQNLTLLSLKELLIRSLVSMRDARKEKEKVEQKLKKIIKRLSGLKLEIAREVAETLDKSGKPLYSNEIKTAPKRFRGRLSSVMRLKGPIPEFFLGEEGAPSADWKKPAGSFLRQPP